MRRIGDPRVRRAPRWLLAVVAVMAVLAQSGTALAAVSTRYSILGAEVWATHTSELHRIHGRFSHGTLRLVDDGGANCGDLRHVVKARLVDVTRSDANVSGTGWLEAVLVHYRVEILGMCVPYSASVNGRIRLSF